MAKEIKVIKNSNIRNIKPSKLEGYIEAGWTLEEEKTKPAVNGKNTVTQVTPTATTQGDE